MALAPFPSLEGILLVSWDVDGTLYSLPALKRRIVLSSCGDAVRLGPRTAWADFCAVRAQHHATEAARAGDAKVLPSLASTAQSATFQHAVHRAVAQLRPSERAVALLEEIAGRHIRQVVLSDYPARAKIESMGLGRYFSDWFDCESLGYWKPSPKSFEQVERTFQVGPAQHLHVGDRPDTDGEGARRAGCHFYRIY